MSVLDSLIELVMHTQTHRVRIQSPTDIIWSAVCLPCYFDVVKSQRVGGQRPREGKKSCRVEKIPSVRPSLRPSVRPSILPPPWLALISCWLALTPHQRERPAGGDWGPERAREIEQNTEKNRQSEMEAETIGSLVNRSFDEKGSSWSHDLYFLHFIWNFKVERMHW